MDITGCNFRHSGAYYQQRKEMMDFQDLYDSYAPDVYRFSLWLSGNRTDAEDVTSETFVRAWARRETIRTRTLKAYLLSSPLV